MPITAAAGQMDGTVLAPAVMTASSSMTRVIRMAPQAMTSSPA